MNYPTHDTDWSESSKGNQWKRVNGRVLVVGRKKDGNFWARVDGTFVEGTYRSIALAMHAAESEQKYTSRIR